MDNLQLAELLFPHIQKKPKYYEEQYPARKKSEQAYITRLGPSPTGFIHLGNLYGAFVDERLAHQSGGLFYLRIEDTDNKRYVEGAVDAIINSLSFFDITFDEGVEKEGQHGDYGPYYQSQRKDLYQCFVKELIKEGKAYPCFLTEEEIAGIREDQESKKLTPGIYQDYAKYRDLSNETRAQRIASGDSYVIRLKSQGSVTSPKEISIDDGIRGIITMPENGQDVVILKVNGMPTYHFAHVCDDHFMRTTHVVRGEEWLSSLPIHVELFNQLGFDLPIYCHTGVLMKLDENGNKRKLSKRKDPELSLDYYKQLGYHPLALREYLLTILNSNYEEWRRDNPEASSFDFPFSLKKMSTSGALFDLNKLNDVAKDAMSTLSAKDLTAFFLKWVKEYRKKLLPIMEGQDEYLTSIFDLGREGNNPRKDLIYAEQMLAFISYFFDSHFVMEEEFPEQVTKEDSKKIFAAYLNTYDHNDDQNQWFEKIRVIATNLGYAAKPKDYKKHPEEYKGHVGHVSTALRIALVGRSQSPDIWEIQQILGESRTRERIQSLMK